jgi:hypothetical protein
MIEIHKGDPIRDPEAAAGEAGERNARWDRNYLDWRNRRIAEFDREYEQFCRECQRQFDEDFEAWRIRRRADDGTASDREIAPPETMAASVPPVQTDVYSPAQSEPPAAPAFVPAYEATAEPAREAALADSGEQSPGLAAGEAELTLDAREPAGGADGATDLPAGDNDTDTGLASESEGEPPPRRSFF